jgi:hypothetical protein
VWLLLFSCAAWAQSSAGVPDATLNIEGFVLDEPCSPKLALSKQLVTPYVINLSALNSRILLTDALGPVSPANSLMELGWAVRISAKSARQGQRGCEGAIH